MIAEQDYRESLPIFCTQTEGQTDNQTNTINKQTGLFQYIYNSSYQPFLATKLILKGE